MMYQWSHIGCNERLAEFRDKVFDFATQLVTSRIFSHFYPILPCFPLRTAPSVSLSIRLLEPCASPSIRLPEPPCFPFYQDSRTLCFPSFHQASRTLSLFLFPLTHAWYSALPSFPMSLTNLSHAVSLITQASPHVYIQGLSSPDNTDSQSHSHRL